jgi:uncharacterized membrane protein
MNIFEALRLVGKYPVVKGIWRNASMVVGLIGIIALLLVVFLWKINTFNWLVFLLILLFAVIATLPIYLPRKFSDEEKRKE